MINPVILQFMSSLFSSDSSANIQSSSSGNGGKHFLTDMQNALHASLGKASSKTHGSMKTNTASDAKGYKYYLETFKKELLAQGKPLSEIFLKEDDLPLVKKFLLQAGFSSEKVDGFIKDLKSNSPDGQISLSYFFQKASELESPKDKAYQNKIIASTTIPYIESILRDFQFTPKEMDNVFSAAKVDGGGLDLNKFLSKVKEISAQKPAADKNGVDQIISKMEMIGIPVKNKEKTEQISPEDFISSLARTSKNVNQSDKQSSEIKKTLDGLLNRVARSDQNASSASPVKISSSYDFTNSLIEEKTDKIRSHLFYKKTISSSDKINTNKNEAISAFLKQKGDKAAHHGQLEVNNSNTKERAGIFSNLNQKAELMDPTEKDNNQIQAKTGQMDAPKTTPSLNFADAVSGNEYNDNRTRDYLQAPLIEQVGKQISKSILRGDRIVRLQLKPPELGTVKIKLDMKDHTLRLAMTAEHHSVKELLLNNIHQLKEALLQQGVKLDTVDVQIDYNFGQSLNGSKEGTHSGPGERQDLNENQIDTNTLGQVTSSAAMNTALTNNLLDLMA
jgi:hypothetical protein